MYYSLNLSKDKKTLDVKGVDLTFAKASAEDKPLKKREQGTAISDSDLQRLTGDLVNDLFQNRSELKILVSKIAMHLRNDFRNDLFKQIDRLLDVDTFDDEDVLISRNSFLSFLVFLSALPPVKRPSLTVGYDQMLFGAWSGPEGKLHIEFLPRRMYRALVSRGKDENAEFFSYLGTDQSLIKFLDDNNLKSWFLDGQEKKEEKSE